jgi:TPR repeat protein
MAASNAGQERRALELMEAVAEEGDPIACFMVALWYLDGEGAPASAERSAFWSDRILALAEAGNLEAQWEVARLYRWGNDFLPLDDDRANAWLERAAAGGVGEAEQELGRCHEQGLYGYAVDPAKAKEWYERAFRRENPETLYLYATGWLGDGMPPADSVKLLRRAAALGFMDAEEVLDPRPPTRPRNPSAKFRKALQVYDAGDLDHALRLMEECAEEGDAIACVNTALWYRRGKGTAADPERAAFWIGRLRTRAEDGNGAAARQLELCYRYEYLLPDNPAEANHWLERATAAGCPDAQYDLAKYREDGRYGYEKDMAVADGLYRLAADQGHPDALYELAIRTFSETGPTDESTALMKKAAEQGCEQASLLLEAYADRSAARRS